MPDMLFLSGLISGIGSMFGRVYQTQEETLGGLAKYESGAACNEHSFKIHCPLVRCSGFGGEKSRVNKISWDV